MLSRSPRIYHDVVFVEVAADLQAKEESLWTVTKQQVGIKVKICPDFKDKNYDSDANMFGQFQQHNRPVPALCCVCEHQCDQPALIHLSDCVCVLPLKF